MKHRTDSISVCKLSEGGMQAIVFRQTMGRWESSAYLLYICIRQAQLQDITADLWAAITETK